MVEFEIEPSVHMRLYSMNKRHFAAIFILFQMSLLCLIIIGLKGPAVTEELIYNITEFNTSEYSLQTGPFVVKSPPVNSFNQQLWLHMLYTIDNQQGKSEVELKTKVRWTGLEMHMAEVNKGQSTEHKSVLTCSNGVCSELFVAHIAYLIHPYYTFNVKTTGLHTSHFDIINIQFKFTMMRSEFTQLEIWFRFAFLLLSFIATCSFAYSLRRFSMQNWSMEQRWFTILLPLLILYNNPIFALTFLTHSSIPGTLDIYVQSSLLATLLLYWLCIYHGIRQIQRRLLTFYLPKLTLVGALWVCVSFMSSWQRFKDLNDPTVGGSYLNLKIVTLVLGSLYCLKLTFLIIRAFAELRNMPYFDLRLKFMTSLVAGMTLLSIIIIATRSKLSIFGIGFFPSFSPHPTSTIEFVVLYGMTNIHIVIMAFVYSPSSNAYYESHFKDNPALSMLNESEDDVIYGEEISLTTNKPVRQANSYISDGDDEDDDAFN